MRHVFPVETVIPQLIHHDFVGREILAALPDDGVLHQRVYGEQQSALAELVEVCPVAQVPDRADGEDEFLPGTAQDDAAQDGGDLFQCHLDAFEFRCRALQAVGDHGAVTQPAEDRAERDERLVAILPEIDGFLQGAVGVFQEFFPAGAGERGVMAERADETGAGAHLYAFGFRERTAVAQAG